MASAVVRGIMRSARKVRASLTPSPSKTSVRRYPSLTSSRPANQKRHLPARKPVSKSRSENGLVSSLRNLSLTPNLLSPSDRSRSTSPKKQPQSGRTRSLSTVSIKNIVDLTNFIKEEKCKNIIVMAGAGISTPSGIPDFRTPGTGLYDNLQEYNIPEATAIFDIEYFWYDPRPFFCLAKTLYPGNYQPNYVHYFIKMLYDKGLLLKIYTQNIDGLERLVGLPPDKLVEAHGTFSSASCIKCSKSYDGDSIKKIILKGSIPRCLVPKCKGIIKPDIVFFGEDLPKKFYSYEDDFPKCDLLIVMGTSLEVQPFAGIVSEVSQSTPRLLINREVVGPFAIQWKGRKNDVVLKGDVVTGVKRLVKLLEWTDIMDEVAKETENWKNMKEAEKIASEKEKMELNERNSQRTKPSGTNGTRNFHTVVGNAAQNATSRVTGNVSVLNKTTETSGNVKGNSTQNPTFKTKVLFPRTSQSNEKIEVKNLSTLGTLPGNCTRVLPPGNATKQSLFACNSVARRMPLLPFRYTHRPVDKIPGNFKSIDPSQDLASAGFGLGRRRETRDAKSYEESSSDSDSSSDDKG